MPANINKNLLIVLTNYYWQYIILVQKFIIIEKGEYRDFFCLGKITMKKYSREQLKKRLIVSIVLGVIMTLALLIPAMFSGSEQLWYAAI